MYYVAVDIGCLECGEHSHVLGIFTNKDIADDVMKEYEALQTEHWHGQHDFMVFIIENLDVVYPVDYADD